MENKKKRLVVIDSNSIIHRAFHALPPLTNKKGNLVGAIYGFLLVFLKVIRELQPDFVAATFDCPGPTFRHKKFKEYKATRPPTPPELYEQIPQIKEILKVFGVPVFEKEGFEADDIVGTISRLAPKKQIAPEIETIILSGDLDILQLIDAKTKVYSLRRGVKDTVLYDERQVKARYQGLEPEQLVDFRGLRGDPSDNIPGVTGIGEKTAINLLKDFGSLENLYKELEEKSEKAKKTKPQIRELLAQQKEQAFLSKALAEIKKNVPINFQIRNCNWGKYEKKKILEILNNYGFKSLIKRLNEIEKQDNKEQGMSGENLKLW